MLFAKTEIKINKKHLYANHIAVKIGYDGKPFHPAHFWAMFPKGTARRLRKQLVREGHRTVTMYSRAIREKI